MYVVKSCRQNLDRKMEFVLAIQSDYWWRVCHRYECRRVNSVRASSQEVFGFSVLSEGSTQKVDIHVSFSSPFYHKKRFDQIPNFQGKKNQTKQQTTDFSILLRFELILELHFQAKCKRFK